LHVAREFFPLYFLVVEFPFLKFLHDDMLY
jgi:hypothetical protein